jgi:hypothetical protein
MKSSFLCTICTQNTIVIIALQFVFFPSQDVPYIQHIYE